MDEAVVRRFAHVMALTAELEANKAELEAMKANGRYTEESFMAVSVTMHQISEELRSLGGVECRTNRDAKDVEGE